MKSRLIAVLLQPCIQVASHTPVRERISAVGSDVNLNQPVTLQVVILSSRRTYHSVLRQHDDTSVTGADTYLVLGTNHAQRLHTTQLGLLDDKLLVAVVEHTAQVSHYDLLACCHVRCSTDYLLRLTLAQVYCCDVQVI